MSATSVADPPGGTLRCARHPGTETVLRCGRCETPICVRCQIPTPVGARCPTCAQVKRFALMLKPRELLLAVVFGIGAGTVGTIILGFIPFLGWIGNAIVGYATAEGVLIGANRKRVRELAPISLTCYVLGYWLGTVLSVLIAYQGALALSPELLVLPIVSLTRGLGILGIGLGALIAWLRAR